MRLLFIDFTLPYLLRDSEFPVGGWAVQLRQWLLGLTALGHQSGVITWKGANAFTGPQSVCELLESHDPKAGIRILKYGYSHIPSMYGAARAWRPDVIIQSTRAIETGIAAFIARRLGVPFVFRVASDADVDARSRIGMPGYARLAYAYGLRNADLIICQNSYQSEQVRRSHPSARLHVQPNIFQLPPDGSEPRPRATRNYVAWLGVFRKPKNVPLLFEVAKASPDIPFHVAGMPAADMDAETASGLESLRGLPNVRFVGYLNRADVAEFLSGAIALLCTSHYEGFSNTFLEAFAAGTPVITRQGVDPDSIIANNGLGRVAEIDDRLPGCIREIHDMVPADYEALARKCRDYVAQHHAPEAIMRSFVEAVRPLTRAAGSA
ncbi:MAG TPA: glycosyltransferase family 4 protein [Rhizomicrobium sp.]|jgi:glycosyltransferase involved in cell wall biosynthesis